MATDIREKYGINIDKHFWENNPLLSSGGALHIHKAILKVAPCTGPGNPLDSQLKYDPQTGEILEIIYEQPTGRTDVSEQVKCKNEVDRKMIKALDAIPWKQRQRGHAMARTMKNTRQKLGLGLQKTRIGVE